MIDHGGVVTALVPTVSTWAMEPVFFTVKENGALPAAELMIVGAVYVTELPSDAITVEPPTGVAATIRQLNVPTLMCWTAETESVKEALTPAPIRPTARANPARSPTSFRRDIVPSPSFCVCAESPGCAK